jgi:hypothetical protein
LFFYYKNLFYKNQIYLNNCVFFWWVSIEIRRYRRSIVVASRDVHNKYLYEKLNKHYPDPELEDEEDDEDKENI